LLGEKGLADFHVLNPEKRVLNLLKIMQDIHSLQGADMLKALSKLDGPNALAMAYGMAFAPDPAAGPPFFDYPYKEQNGEVVKDPSMGAMGKRDGQPKTKVHEYHDNLAKLRASPSIMPARTAWIGSRAAANIWPSY